jgi:hypothetical protein
MSPIIFDDLLLDGEGGDDEGAAGVIPELNRYVGQPILIGGDEEPFHECAGGWEET